jgi:hypothetical protein
MFTYLTHLIRSRSRLERPTPDPRIWHCDDCSADVFDSHEDWAHDPQRGYCTACWTELDGRVNGWEPGA